MALNMYVTYNVSKNDLGSVQNFVYDRLTPTILHTSDYRIGNALVNM